MVKTFRLGIFTSFLSPQLPTDIPCYCVLKIPKHRLLQGYDSFYSFNILFSASSPLLTEQLATLIIFSNSSIQQLESSYRHHIYRFLLTGELWPRANDLQFHDKNIAQWCLLQMALKWL